MIEQPVALFQTLRGNLFHLANCVQMQSEINAFPAVLAQGYDVLNRPLLLLPTCICKGFCDGPLGKIECSGKTERNEIAGKTSVILDAFTQKLFHLCYRRCLKLQIEIANKMCVFERTS